MRVCIIVASLALSVIGTAQGTVVDTGADAQKYCELLVKGSFDDNVEARSAGECAGMIESAMVFSSNLPHSPADRASTLSSNEPLNNSAH